MDRIKRISNELLERYPNKFSTNFEENKATIKETAIVRSKVLRNKVAGYITSYLRRQDVSKELPAATSLQENAEEEEVVKEAV
jgi:small subunit ribosomal protein S17e